MCQFLCLPFCPPSRLSLPPSRAGLLCGGSLVPLGGHYWSPEECFGPQAEAMRSGVASPWTPDLEKLSAARSGTAKLKCLQLKPSRSAPCLYLLIYTAPSCVPFFRALFWWSLSEPSGDLSHFMSALMQTGLREKNTQSPPPCPWHSRLFGCLARIPPLNSGGPTGAGSVPLSPVGLCERTASALTKQVAFSDC